ncbi:MAG: DoxX family protein [Actinomycetales bacterium]
MTSAATKTARLLSGVPYAVLGYQNLQNPAPAASLLAPATAKVRAKAPFIPNDELLVRINAGAQTVAGSLLALGVAPRLAALALVGSLVPTTLVGHPFWTVQDEAARKQQRTQFLKNAAMLGGLVLAAAPSAPHRGDVGSTAPTLE